MREFARPTWHRAGPLSEPSSCSLGQQEPRGQHSRAEEASKQAALHAADVAVVNDDTDVQVISDHQPPKRWPSGEPLVVAGVEFERELFE